jgi:hypothetical protein
MRKLKNWLGGAGIIVFLAFTFRALTNEEFDIPPNFQILLLSVFGGIIAADPISEGLRKRREEKDRAAAPEEENP